MLSGKIPSILTFLTDPKSKTQIVFVLSLGAIFGFVQLISFLETAIYSLD